MVSINKQTLLRCMMLLLVANLVSSSSLRRNNNNVGIEQSSTTHQRYLQSDGQQSASPSGGSDSGSTLVIVGAVGAVISILVLIGGVCYAKRQYNSDKKGSGRRQYLSDTTDDKDISNIISSMEKNAAKKEKGGGGGGGGYFKRSNSRVPGEGGETYTNNNGRAVAFNNEEVGYESDAPPPPPEHDEQTWDDESDVHFMTNNGIGAGNKSVADHTTGDDDMSYAFSVDQTSIAPYNRQQNNSIDPYIGGAAMQSFQNEKGGVFEWNEDGTKMVYTPAVGDDEKRAQNGFVYDEQKMKWVVSKQVVGAKGVSFNPTTSANDGKKSAMMKSPKELQRTLSDASTKSYGSGTTGNSGMTGMGSEFTFNAVGTDYSTVRTRSGTTFVSTGIAIPSPNSAAGTEEVEVEGVSAIDRLMLLDRDDDLSDGSTTDENDDGAESNLGHVAGDLGDDEPGMIIPKKTVSRIGANTIKEDSPFDEGGAARPRPKPVPNFDSSPRHFVRKNRKPSFGRRV